MGNKKLYIIIGLVVVSIILVLVFRNPDTRQSEEKTADASVTPEQESETSTSNVSTPALSDDAGREAMYIAFSNQVKQRFAGRLDNPYWRLKLVNDLMLAFQKQYPDNWMEEIERFFRNNFPDIADDLIAKLHALIEYNQWLETLKSTMQFSSLKERQDALWEKRLALFGEDAYQIWEAALKNEQLQEKLNNVNEHVGNFNERAELYMDSLREVFGEDIISEEAPHKTQMMTKFLELENVQGELSNLPEEDRYQQLREFREAMGMDEEALDRWDQLDQERIELWSNSERYMSEREALQSQYQGEEFNDQLWKLQVEIFGETEASYIQKEERSGYYRFKGNQKYGLN